MRIRFLGHSAFALTTADGTRVIMDPYQAGAFGGAIGHAAIPDPADVITISHAHADHNDAKSVPGSAIVLNAPGEFTEHGITFRGIATYHDAKRGAERGPNIVWCVRAEGLQVCHLGDLGTPLAAREVDSAGPIDVLLVPVGGTFTIDARGATEVVKTLTPHLVIPMHYRSPKVKINLDPVEEFLREKRHVRRLEESELEVTTKSLPQETEVVVLRAAL